jgi:hypothetical protein
MLRLTKNLLIALCVTTSGCLTESARRDPGLGAEARALTFLQREVPAWSKENGCFSCHNNGDAARALYAATRQGYRIGGAALADTTEWVSQPERWQDNKGDPGFSDQRLANLQFAASLLAGTESGHVSRRAPLRTAARKVAADQGPEGAWVIEPANPVGSPATLGTTLATYLALRILSEGGGDETRGAAARALNWLNQVPIDNVVSAATLVLASAGDSSTSAQLRREHCWQFLRKAQTSDGGWGPYADSPPESFDTAITLLALAEIRGFPDVGEAIRRGRSFLMSQQQGDGGWPATTRPSGGESYAQRLSTTGWATQALLATKE